MEHSYITKTGQYISMKILVSTKPHQLLSQLNEILPMFKDIDDVQGFISTILDDGPTKQQPYQVLRSVLKKYGIPQYKLAEVIYIKKNTLNAKLLGVSPFKEVEKIRIKEYLHTVTGFEINNLFDK